MRINCLIHSRRSASGARAERERSASGARAERERRNRELKKLNYIWTRLIVLMWLKFPLAVDHMRKGRFILCRRPHQGEHILTFSVCISTNSATEFPAISLACCVCTVYEHKCDCAFAHMENYAACALQFEECCGLRQTLPQAAAQAAARAAAQAAARKLQREGRMVFYVCVRAIAFMFIHTQHSSEIDGNSVALLVEIQRKLKYVQLCAACGPPPAACGKVWTNQANSLILLFVRPATKYEPALSLQIHYVQMYYHCMYGTRTPYPYEHVQIPILVL